MRAGPRSEQTPLTLAVVEVLNQRLSGSTLHSVHRLAKAVSPTISRSQLYLLMGGQAVIDLAEFSAVCDALGVPPDRVLVEAEETVVKAEKAAKKAARAAKRAANAERRRRAVAAYDETYVIEDEQISPEEA